MKLRTMAALFALCLAVCASHATDEQGIEIHGRWTIEILSPEGNSIAKHEFNNALVNPAAVATLLIGDAVSSNFYILLTNQTAGSSGMGPCNPDCEIALANANIGLTPESTNLTVTQTGTNFETIRLAGSLTVGNTSTIDLVQSWVGLCSNTVTPTQCFSSPDSLSVFTSRVLSTAINVTAGQIVQVTVDLTVS